MSQPKSTLLSFHDAERSHTKKREIVVPSTGYNAGMVWMTCWGLLALWQLRGVGVCHCLSIGTGWKEYQSGTGEWRRKDNLVWGELGSRFQKDSVTEQSRGMCHGSSQYRSNRHVRRHYCSILTCRHVVMAWLWNALHGLMSLSIWSLTGGAVLGSYRINIIEPLWHEDIIESLWHEDIIESCDMKIS